MFTLTLIRHGECYIDNQWNTEFNPGLIPKGRRTASEITGHYDHVIISPMKRTLETFDFSRISGNHVQVNSLFREVRLNKVDFMEQETLDFEHPKDFLQRIQKAKDYLVSLNVSNVAVVTHAGFIRQFLNTDKHINYGEKITIEYID